MELNETARLTAEEILSKMDMPGSISLETSNDRLRVNIKLDEAGFLIGKEGENLRALQHIFLLMVSKRMSQNLYASNIVLDVNDYYKEREVYLESLAKNTAERVKNNKVSEELFPMSAQERKIIHLTIEKISGVSSESLGDGEYRRVIIKPAEAADSF